MFLYILISLTGLIIFIYYYINVRYLIPKKEVIKNKINKVLVGLPVIDRDFYLTESFYNNLINSIKNIKNINFDLFIVTRKEDKKIINFWKDKAKINLVDNYKIKKRHNMKNLSKKFNIIKNYADDNNYDALIIIESDIIIKNDTIPKLIRSLNKSHISLFPFETPWTGYPLIVEDNFYYKLNNTRNLKQNELFILGHGTGCIIINKQVLKDKNINFNREVIFNIEGQDVGFFNKVNQNYYKVLMINEELGHRYQISDALI